eukprot:751344-Hanusia_phi.AAC.6
MPAKKGTSRGSNAGDRKGENRGVVQTVLDEVVDIQTKKLFITSWKSRIIRITPNHVIVAKTREDLSNPDADVKRVPFPDILNVITDEERGFRLKINSSEMIVRTTNSNRRDTCVQFLKSSMATFAAKDYSGFVQSDDMTHHWEPNLPLLQYRSRTTSFALSKVYKDTAEWKVVSERFLKGLEQTFLVRIMRVQNKDLHMKTRTYVEMLQQRLRADASGQNGVNQYGKGCYFATSCDLAARFAATVDEDLARALAVHPARLVGCKSIFLATLFVGDVTVGDHMEGSAPVIPESRTKRRYDTFADKLDNPTILVSTSDAQSYPSYVILFSSGS